MPPKASTTTGRPGTHARNKQSTAVPGAVDSTAAKDRNKQQSKDKEDRNKEKEKTATAMPPPPPPQPQAILEPEMGALEESLKNTTVTAGQIFRFYADTKRLGVHRHAPRPPRSMTSSLAYELGRYDQICDAMESHLSRAIAILQRDLTREENRLREEEAEKAREQATQPAPTDTDVEMTNATSSSSDVQQATPANATGTGKAPLRRPSKISLSTLHRNPFPLKLDLSSAALRLSTDDAGLNIGTLGNLSALGGMNALSSIGIPGLASPVTLAPKSARPMAPGEIPPEILAALASAAGAGTQNTQMQDQNQSHNQSQQVDIDLTLEDDLQASTGMQILNANGSLGNSADKPIELDIDLDAHMSNLTADIFGDQKEGESQGRSNADVDVEALFSPNSTRGSNLPIEDGSSTSMDMSLLNALSEGQSQRDALFASFNVEGSAPGNTSETRGPAANASSGENGSNADASASFDYDQLGMGDMGEFFNASNQEEIDMIFLGMGDSGTAGSTSENGRPSGSEGVETSTDVVPGPST
ncbi:hypothetical protein DFH11DRAFT_1561348 [Phellopilus nigrolimitatus]|nr:hypothetical protein DFH11DRAFT_1561348 [Phellopilus nigrolimitatus]